MAKHDPYSATGNAFETRIENFYTPDEQYELFNLQMPDERLSQMLINSLNKDMEYWDKEPWQLTKTDLENIKFFLGDQLDDKDVIRFDTSYIDNRLFESVRSILSYATGQLAKPEVIPSRSDDFYLKMASSIQQALYQHSADEQAGDKFRAAVLNLLLRKRAFLKLRYDPEKGMYGDIVTEVVPPEDIVIDRNARFMDNPNIIYQRIRCTVDELVAKFPSKKAEILQAFGIVQGRFTQMNRLVTYFEAWFTYRDSKNTSQEGVCWFLHDPQPLILDKMPNPNWIYTGDPMRDKQTNVLFTPPKPFVWFNYLNLGRSFIDETTLFDQAKPLQKLLNKRIRQINENADYVNGRWVGSREAINQEDGDKLINKGSKTVLLVNSEDVGKSLQVVAPQQYPQWAYATLDDARNEIDGIMGTPSVFRGANPGSQDTLGRDLLLKQQAGMLQDDLVNCVMSAYERYYSVKLQMMRVYYTDDYWFQVKGGDGKFDFVMINGDSLDSNVKVGVQADSNLPLDKASIMNTAMDLAKMNKIDIKTLYEDLGLPDADLRAEKYMKSQLQPLTYMQSVEQEIDSNDAEVDLNLLIGERIPQERDNYDENYLNYFNNFVSQNKFRMLPPQTQQAITTFLSEVTQRAQRTAGLQTSMLDDAGMIDNVPPPAPVPKVSITGALPPQDAEQLVGIQPQVSAPPQPPTNPQDLAQSPNMQAPNI